jgi:hypothetical protein
MGDDAQSAHCAENVDFIGHGLVPLGGMRSMHTLWAVSRGTVIFHNRYLNPTARGLRGMKALFAGGPVSVRTPRAHMRNSTRGFAALRGAIGVRNFARRPGQRRSSRRARAGQGPVLAILAMLAIARCAWLRVAPLLA